jgi:hypothetical protein
MNNDIKRLLLEAVNKQAQISEIYGVALNQKDKNKHFEEWKNDYISGVMTKEKIQAYIDEPLPEVKVSENNSKKVSKKNIK